MRVRPEHGLSREPDEQRQHDQPEGERDRRRSELAARCATARSSGLGMRAMKKLGRSELLGPGGHNSAAMQKIRAAVVGVGYLGTLPRAEVRAAARTASWSPWWMPGTETRESVAAELSTQGLADYRELLGKVDAVSVATTTPAHFAIARDFLEAGAHVLVEKPITETPAQARELIDTRARATG